MKITILGTILIGLLVAYSIFILGHMLINFGDIDKNEHFRKGVYTIIITFVLSILIDFTLMLLEKDPFLIIKLIE